MRARHTDCGPVWGPVPEILMRKTFALFVVLLTSAPATLLGQAGPAELSAAGWHAIKTDDGDSAAELFGRALALKPEDPVLHLGAGAAAHLQGREDAAAAALAAALDIDPTLTVASKLLAEIAYQRGDISLAIGTYERALFHAPDSAEISARLDRLTSEASRRAAAARFTLSIAGHREDALATQAASVLDAAYWRVAKLVGAYPSDSIAVELDTTRPFQSTSSLPIWKDDRFDGRMAINAGGASADPDAFARVLTHELTHAMISSMAPTGVPSWLHEGFAQLAEPADTEAAVRRLKEAGPIAWPSERALRSDAPNAQRQADVSLLIARALVDRVGATSTRIFDELADGHPLDEALAQFGFAYADLQADVARSLQ